MIGLTCCIAVVYRAGDLAGRSSYLSLRISPASLCEVYSTVRGFSDSEFIDEMGKNLILQHVDWLLDKYQGI